MKKYIVTYHAPISAIQQMQDSDPGDAAKAMEAWDAWGKKCGDKLIDIGMPIYPSQTLDTKGNWSDSTRQVAGYSIIQANDMEDAKRLMDNHPHMSGWNDECEIELHETMRMPQMDQ